MKRWVRMASHVLLIVLFVGGNAAALDRESGDDCGATTKEGNMAEHKAREVARIIEKEGVDAAIAAIRSPNSPYASTESYVFLIDMNGKILYHPKSAQLRGTNVKVMMDATGKQFIRQFMAVAREKGEGWVDYQWMNPDRRIRHKQTFVYKVPGQNVMVLAGIFLEC